jgi:hypothetical protein
MAVTSVLTVLVVWVVLVVPLRGGSSKWTSYSAERFKVVIVAVTAVLPDASHHCLWYLCLRVG